MRRSAWAGLILAAVSGLGEAQAAAVSGSHAFIAMGYDDVACSTWTRARTENGQPALIYAAWVYGFISAYNNYALKTDPDVAAGTDLDSIGIWVDGYCRESPADTLMQATMALLDALAENSRAK